MSGATSDAESDVNVDTEAYLDAAAATLGYVQPADKLNPDLATAFGNVQGPDTVRGTGAIPLDDNDDTPQPDTTEEDATGDGLFGSSHPGLFQTVYCDGSVHVVTYAIDRLVWASLGNRSDGLPLVGQFP